jgi:hypothetical protein
MSPSPQFLLGVASHDGGMIVERAVKIKRVRKAFLVFALP